MTFFDAAILGIVEGFTEFLPISSTGHLILTSTLLGLEDSAVLGSFMIAIQLGAILAVVALFFRRFFNLSLLVKLGIAFIPTGLIGLLVYPFVKSFLIGNEVVVVWSLFIGGIALIAFEYLHGDRSLPSEFEDPLHDITHRQSLVIGLFQAIAIIPGVSRSGATILGGLALGLSRRAIVEFSFLLAVPTMLAATGYDMLHSASLFRMDQFALLAVGFGVSCVVALLSLKLLLSFVRRYSFVPFGVYRIVIAVLFALVVLA
jgi:undecaprenyl-diphosphatase